MAKARPKKVVLAELAEARTALAVSVAAIRSHGHQAVTWQFYGQDAAHVKRLEIEAGLRMVPAYEWSGDLSETAPVPTT